MRTVRALLMAPLCQALCLALLLVTAQHGAFVHDLGHLSHEQGSTQHASEPPCDLCPAYAQAASPIFGHAFVPPVLALSAPDPVAAPLVHAAQATLPTPRSRGPPFLS